VLLTTARLRVRPWQDGDAAALYAIYRERAVARWLDQRPHRSPDDARAGLTRLRARATEAPPLGWYALEVRATGAVVGNGGLQRMPGGGPVEVGYHLARAAWGQGYATEFLRGALAHALGPLGEGRVVAVTLPTNHASRRVMERAGMRPAGTLDFKGYWSLCYEARRGEWR
jgi:RimJ/RimL family protein N-acetyltransferase